MLNIGQLITDGTVTFILRDVRDCTPVGRPVIDTILRPGYVKRNGALLRRDQYPSLVQYLKDNPSEVTTEVDWPSNKNLYTWGDGGASSGTTIRVPDDRNRYEQLSDVVRIIEAGLPNITGSFYLSGGGYTSTCAGAFYPSGPRANQGHVGTSGDTTHTIYMNAARESAIYGRSTTVTPPTITRISQMKY